MSKEKKIVIAEGFEYSDGLFEMVIEPGIYNFVENGINGYPMILIDEGWIDLADFDSIDWIAIYW